GTFVRDPLRRPNRLMLTAAAADRTSFGCAAEAPYTYYDGCFLRTFATVSTWLALHQAVSRCVAAAERQLRAPPSHPQAFFGGWRAAVPIPPPWGRRDAPAVAPPRRSWHAGHSGAGGPRTACGLRHLAGLLPVLPE